ncbi:hypothetical protein BO70DRAFT_361685 [Aspergillus heteromorphus CBS 117.55]|uniref:Uncharacterized protein n=1 Tax=Aspergillus heteromorphus CBS 117.55 TaxID=1448321 RepID=A0A317WBL4_9EURO|nr:uncharacterized protein BO70DRAFT_361685 [Aspergillus heteromorphus CBS 117.55]PWY83589.1 hypothetical protein BO70DRAFT_361685 [Aspergillus heteromorphus CBS 117.55]
MQGGAFLRNSLSLPSFRLLYGVPIYLLLLGGDGEPRDTHIPRPQVFDSRSGWAMEPFEAFGSGVARRSPES